MGLGLVVIIDFETEFGSRESSNLSEGPMNLGSNFEGLGGVGPDLQLDFSKIAFLPLFVLTLELFLCGPPEKPAPPEPKRYCL